MDVLLGFVATSIGPRIEEVGGMTCIITLIFLERETPSIGNVQRKKGELKCTSGAGPIWCGFRIKNNE
jgi:hypothetical protein